MARQAGYGHDYQVTDEPKPIFEVGAALAAMLEAASNLDEMFLRHAVNLPSELQTAFIRFSLARAELQNISGRMTEDHPSLFDPNPEGQQ